MGEDFGLIGLIDSIQYGSSIDIDVNGYKEEFANKRWTVSMNEMTLIKVAIL